MDFTFDRDRIRTDSNFANLRSAAFQVMSRLDGVDPSDQIRALFIAAVVMAETVGLDPHEEISRARKTIPYTDNEYTTTLTAMRDYAANELKPRP